MAEAPGPVIGPSPASGDATAGRWTATAILSGCFALSYIDRQVLSLLVPSLKKALDCSDTEIGLLQGISFSLFYVAASLPLAALADRYNRARIASVCIAVWSVMTMVCGLAGSFVHLLLARIGLAVAEAGLPPAALTLMSDLHDRKGLARATALFMLAPFVGGGIALAAGGMLLEAMHGPAEALGMAPWRLVFICAGVPGVLLAPIVWTLVKDTRVTGGTQSRGASFGRLADYMLANWRFTASYILGLAVMVVVLNAHIAWMPAAILRRFPVGEAAMGASFGVTYLIAGSIGTLGAGWIISRSAPDAMLGRTVSMMSRAAMLLVPFAIAAPFAPGLLPMIGLAGIAVFCTSGVVAMGPVPLQITVPPDLRAQAIAVNGLVAALLGTGLGPLLTGVISDLAAQAGAREPLSVALSVVGGGCAAIAALLMRCAYRNAPGRQTLAG